jgi:RNA polymerase sigma-70 factor (ECF subfamily)
MTASSLTNGALPLPRVEPADDAEEAALLEAARGGCARSFRLLVEHHQGRIHRFCFRYLRDEGDALEACQDTFIRAHGALGRFRPTARFSTWLFQIALNLCRDQRRRKRRDHVAIEDHQSHLTCHRAAPDEAVMRDADLARLDEGLAALPEKCRAVLVLCCLEGLDHAECGAILKCSPRAVEGRLYRARRRLTEWWNRQER